MLACFFHGLLNFLLLSLSKSWQIRRLVDRGSMISSTKPINREKYYKIYIYEKYNRQIIWRTQQKNPNLFIISPIYKSLCGGRGNFLVCWLWALSIIPFIWIKICSKTYFQYSGFINLPLTAAGKGLLNFLIYSCSYDATSLLPLYKIDTAPLAPITATCCEEKSKKYLNPIFKFVTVLKSVLFSG